MSGCCLPRLANDLPTAAGWQGQAAAGWDERIAAVVLIAAGG